MVRPRVFFDINHGTEPMGRIVVELYQDQAPKTCENFLSLATTPPSPTPSYRQTPFHRIIDDFMIQGGDTTRGDGTGGQSIFGSEFEDENLGWRELDRVGLVCMANRGKGTNTSQFFITLAPCPHLNGKHTVFGHIVEGHLIVQMMAKVKVDKQDRPVTDVIIARCGEIEMRGASKKPLPDGAPNVLEEKAKNGEKVIDSSPRRRTDLGPGSADRRLSETIPRDNGSVHQDTDHRRERHARRDDSRDRTRRGRSRARSYSTDIGSASPSKSDSKHASKTDQLHPGQSHSHRERRRKRRRSESPSRSTTPSKRAAGSPDQRRRRHRSHSRQRAHDLQRTPNTGYARYRYGDEYRSYAYDQDTHREDELLLRQQEMVRDGGYDRFEGAVGEDDVESRYKGGYGGIENRRGDGRDHRQAEKASEKSTVKFKGRGRMSYREEGEGRLL